MTNNDLTQEDFLQKFSLINDNPAAVQAHRDWEERDAEWKALMKADASRYDIMVAANRVRNARSYKDLLFDEAARQADALASHSGILIDYDRKVLGRATQIGEVQELSRQWHDLRRRGVGGSSLSEAIGFHWKSFPGSPVWMTQQETDDHWAAMAREKSTPAAEPQPVHSGVLFRGHMWEPALLCYYSTLYDVPIGVSKATWRGHRDIQVVNVDGIILDHNNNPVGIAECKTSSREWTWDHGVPVHYRAQVLWYLDATGLEYADVIVRFDSGKIDIHRIHTGETIDGSSSSGTINYYLPSVNSKWKHLTSLVQDPVRIWDEDPMLQGEIHALDKESVYSFTDGYLMDLRDLLDDATMIKIDVVAPYERMDSSYNRSLHITTNTGIDHNIQNVSPAYYPTPADYDPREGMHMEEVDAELGERAIILALDNPTYYHLCMLYGSEDIVNLSALRRAVELLPGKKDLESIDDGVEWLTSVIAQERNN